MKKVVIVFVAPEIRGELSPFYTEIILGDDSMDDGTIRALHKDDIAKCRLINPGFWKSCKNLKILNKPYHDLVLKIL